MFICYQFIAQFSLLFHAAEFDNDFAFKLLLKHKANPAWENNYGTSVIYLQAKRNQAERARHSFKFIPTQHQKEGLVNQTKNNGSLLI